MKGTQTVNEDLSGLSLVELIERMANISVPQPVSYAPQTAGWWLLAGLLLCVAGGTLFVWLRRRKANAYRREARQVLRSLEPRLAAATDEAVYRDLAVLVRRTALAAFPRGDVASLYGDEWLEFLDRTGGGDFAHGPGRAIATAPYDGGKTLSTSERAALGTAVKTWVEQHRGETQHA